MIKIKCNGSYKTYYVNPTYLKSVKPGMVGEVILTDIHDRFTIIDYDLESMNQEIIKLLTHRISQKYDYEDIFLPGTNKKLNDVFYIMTVHHNLYKTPYYSVKVIFEDEVTESMNDDLLCSEMELMSMESLMEEKEKQYDNIVELLDSQVKTEITFPSVSEVKDKEFLVGKVLFSYRNSKPLIFVEDDTQWIFFNPKYFEGYFDGKKGFGIFTYDDFISLEVNGVERINYVRLFSIASRIKLVRNLMKLPTTTENIFHFDLERNICAENLISIKVGKLDFQNGEVLFEEDGDLMKSEVTFSEDGKEKYITLLKNEYTSILFGRSLSTGSAILEVKVKNGESDDGGFVITENPDLRRK